MILLSYTIVDFYLFSDGAVDIIYKYEPFWQDPLRSVGLLLNVFYDLVLTLYENISNKYF